MVELVMCLHIQCFQLLSLMADLKMGLVQQAVLLQWASCLCLGSAQTSGSIAAMLAIL
jgi:hypothetical protein